MPKVTLYADISGIPHTFLGLTDNNGTSKYRGFSPDKTGLFGNGSVKEEYDYETNTLHEYDFKFEFEVGDEKFDALNSAIKKSAAEKPYYNLPNGSQCTVWAMSMLQEAGITEQYFEPNFKKFNEGFLGALDGYFQTLVYNPYTQSLGMFANDAFSDLANSLYNFLGFITPQWLKDILPELYDPIALDLDEDGVIAVISAKDGSVYFDHNGDKIGFRSSWIGSQDGLLVFDRNSNRTIDNGSELFGNFTIKSNNELANNGFEALSEFDSNNNGIISNSDENFDKLQIWQDFNSDGISQSDELKTLHDLGIESLNLNKFPNFNLLVA